MQACSTVEKLQKLMACVDHTGKGSTNKSQHPPVLGPVPCLTLGRNRKAGQYNGTIARIGLLHACLPCVVVKPSCQGVDASHRM